jgi:hypothetical protein
LTYSYEDRGRKNNGHLMEVPDSNSAPRRS